MKTYKKIVNPLLFSGIQKISNSDLSYFDATVGGATAVYPATSVANGLKKAIQDGHTKLKFLDNVTVFENITLSADITEIDLNGFALSFADTEIAGNGKTLKIQNGSINSTNDGASCFLEINLILNNCTITDNNVNSNYFVYSPHYNTNFTNCAFYLNGKMQLTRSDMSFISDNCVINSSVALVVILSNGFHTNLQLNGTFYTGSYSGGGALYHVNVINISSDAQMSINSIRGEHIDMPNATIHANKYVNIKEFKLSHFGSFAKPSFLKDGTFLNAGNCNTDSNYPTKDAVFENVTFVGNLTLGANSSFLKLRNCIITGNLTVNSSNCTFDNCKLENGTITVSATADKTILDNNRTLTSIIDNGTNTEISSTNILI